MSSPLGTAVDDSSGTGDKTTTPQDAPAAGARAAQTDVPFSFMPFSSTTLQPQTTPQVPATTPTAVSSSTASPPAFTLSSQPFSFTTPVTPSAYVTVSPAFSSSIVPATRGTKRSSISRARRDSDDDDDDEEDNADKDRDDDNEDEEELIHDEELDERPRKRAYPASAYYTGHEDLYEDEEEDEEYLPTSNTSITQPRRTAVLSDDEQTEFKTNTASGEETFFDLLTHFAALHVPTSSTKLEPCPLCDVSFPLSEFADHVYQCIKKLDDVEKKEQERLDEKMARQLMDREVRMLNHHNPYYYHHHHRRHHNHTHRDAHGMVDTTEYHPVRECPDGVNCTRTDEQHFLLVPHPDVNCPNCDQPVPLHDINNHLNTCLTRKVGEKTSNTGNTMEDGDTTTDKPTTTTAAVQTPALSGPAITNTNRFDMTSAAFLAPRDRDTKQPRSRQDADDDEDKNLPVRRDGDDDEEVAEDEDYDIDGLPRPTRGWSTNLDNPDALRMNSISHLTAPTSVPAPSSAASTTTSTSTTGSNSLKLTREQASAVASLVISRKEQFERNNARHSASSPTNDPSLAQLLDTFRSLGFTAENLSKLKEEEQQSKNKGTTSSAAGAATAAPQTSATQAPVSTSTPAGPQRPIQP